MIKFKKAMVFLVISLLSLSLVYVALAYLVPTDWLSYGFAREEYPELYISTVTAGENGDIEYTAYSKENNFESFSVAFEGNEAIAVKVMICGNAPDEALKKGAILPEVGHNVFSLYGTITEFDASPGNAYMVFETAGWESGGEVCRNTPIAWILPSDSFCIYDFKLSFIKDKIFEKLRNR